MEPNVADQHRRIEIYDQQFKRAPRLYRAKVVVASFLGYLVFFAAFLFSLGILAGLIFLHLEFGGNVALYFGYVSCLLTLVSVVRSAFTAIPPPPGIEIRAEDFPYLFRIVDSLRSQLKAGRKEIRIVVDWNYNAFAFSRPKFGIVGPATRYLGIGLPLLASLNQEQIRAVIAHEMAHFSRSHSRFSSRVGRLEMMWTELLHRLRRRPISGFPYRAFVKRYSRWLSSLYVVIRRNDEFEADRVAAKAVDGRAVAEGLLRIALRSALVVDRHWRDTWQIALVSDQPARFPVSRLFDRLGRTVDERAAIAELRWMLATATEAHDEHPSVADRISALGFEVPRHSDDLSRWLAEWPVLRPDSTLKHFIGRQVAVAGSLDEIWRIVNRDEWREMHIVSKPLVRQMTKLDQEWKESGKLSVEKAWRRAEITAALYGGESIVPIADYILAKSPSHSHANFIKGCDLLRRYDSLGIVHVEAAIESDPLSYKRTGLDVLSDYYRRMGANVDSLGARDESFSAADETALAVKERTRKVRLRETFLPHDLPEEEVRELAECFGSTRSIRRVYIVRRKVAHLPQSSFYVLAFVTRWGANPFSGGKGRHFSLGLIFSRDHVPVILGLSSFLLRAKVSRIPGSLIYRRRPFGRRQASIHDSTAGDRISGPTGA